MKLLHIKINQILVFIFLLNIVFVSCKKIEENKNSENLSEGQSKIQNWLTSQKTNNTVERNIWIDALNKNLLYGQMWTERNEDVQFIIVPIHDTFKFKNNKGQRVSNYFVSAINANSKIIYSLIVQNKPTNHQNSTDLKEGAIANIFYNRSANMDGNVRFITIFDNFLYTKNYKNNEYVSTSNLSKRIDNKGSNTSNNNTSSVDGCIDWYWVTTYADGTQIWEYSFTSCPGGGCYDTQNASICPEGEGGGGGGGSQPLPTDPCADAQTGSTHATNLSQNSNFTSAKTNIISAASNGNEHVVTFGRDANGNITTSNIRNGTGNSGTAPNWPGAFADLHNHTNEEPPSSGDLYEFIDKSKANSSFETRYILTNNGTVYALTVTNQQQANIFNLEHPRVPNQGFEPDFPDIILEEINMMKGHYGATAEMAMAFVMEKYNMGVALLKQDSNGNFKRLNTIENKSTNGTLISYTPNNCH